MDYIVRYRDLPWGVAAGAFFGKLGWTLINPFIASEFIWKQRIIKVLKFMAFTTVAITCMILLAIALDHLFFDGTGSAILRKALP